MVNTTVKTTDTQKHDCACEAQAKLDAVRAICDDYQHDGDAMAIVAELRQVLDGDNNE